MKFPATIRLDQSDAHIYQPAAAPGEWAISGAFLFANRDPESLTRAERQAFVHGFLGTASFGWSTFVQVAEIGEEEESGVVDALVKFAVAHFGAPDEAMARPAAREEVAFAASLCDHKINTLLSVERDFGQDGIVERFKVIQPPREAQHTKIWTIETEEDGSA